MKSKTILGADGTTEMREITVGIHGKGGEVGIRAVQQLAGMVSSSSVKRRRKYTTDIYRLRGIANAVLIADLWTKREQTSLCA